jgi:hypothetical protein
MKNWNEEDFKIPQAPLPFDVFEGVKKGVITARIAAQRTRRNLTIAASCLLIVGVINCGIVLSESQWFKNENKTAKATETLYNSFFKTSQSPFDE